MITAPDLVSKYIELEHAKRKLEQQVDDVETQLKLLETEIVEEWLEARPRIKHVKTDRGTLFCYGRLVLVTI